VSEQVKVSIIYYSATGTTYELAKSIAEGAEKAGAIVTIKKVRELAPDEAVASNQGWQQHLAETQDVPEATADDVVGADAVIFGSPTRYGNVAAQLKQFIDQAGGLWQEGGLADKPVTAFTSAINRHGGSEATILSLGNVFYHWGALIVPPGYTDPVVSAAGGNPYGTSFVTGTSTGNGPDAAALEAARYQGRRLAQITIRLLGGGRVTDAAGGSARGTEAETASQAA
jgi:NAD(P)H dehydrogenase (quinone)